LLAETGIIGFLLFSLFLISIFLRAINYANIENKALFIFLFSIFLSYLFPIKPGGSIFSSMNSFYMFYILGWILYSSNYNDIRIRDK
jgi:O-antigen ligase